MTVNPQKPRRRTDMKQTRDVEDAASVCVRRVPADERIPPTYLDAVLLAGDKAISSADRKTDG